MAAETSAAGVKDSIPGLISDLEAASKLPAKARKQDVKPTVEKLTTLLYEGGAAPDDLVRLVGVVAAPEGTNHLSQAALGRLARNLFPAAGTRVPERAVLAVVGCLGHGELRPSLAIQAVLLRWLVLVYHVLESHDVLFRSYVVMFNLLDTAVIRPQLCHLLALITRRQHVRPFRIQSTLELSRQTGHDRNLVGLLRVYKNYYPEVVAGDMMRAKSTPFKYPDLEWRERLETIQAQRPLQQHPTTNIGGAVNDPWATHNGFTVNNPFGHRQRGRGRPLVPPVQTSHATEQSVILEEIRNVEHLVQNLEMIELPNQLVAVMADPLLQKLLMLLPAAGTTQPRINNWLDACLLDACEGAWLDHGSALLDLMEIVRDYAVRTKTLHPVYERILPPLFTAWDGVERRDVVLEALTYLPFRPWKEVYREVLQSLDRKVCTSGGGGGEPLRAMTSFYTELCRRWLVSVLSSASSSPSPSSISSNNATAAATAAASSSTIPEHTPSTLSALVDHVNKLALFLVTFPSSTTSSFPTDNNNASSSSSSELKTHLVILDFYRQAATLFSHPILLRHMEIVAPAPPLIYFMAFSSSPAVLSAACGVLASYKRGVEAAMAVPPPRRRLTPRDLEQISQFNNYFMDVCNCLWRARAFDRTDVHGTGCSVSDGVVGRLAPYADAFWGESTLPPGVSVEAARSSGRYRMRALQIAFGLSRNPALGLQSIGFFRRLEDEEIAADADAQEEDKMFVDTDVDTDVDDDGGVGDVAGATGRLHLPDRQQQGQQDQQQRQEQEQQPPLLVRHAGPVTSQSLRRLAADGGLSLSWQEYRLGVLQALEENGFGGVGDLVTMTIAELKKKRNSSQTMQEESAGQESTGAEA